MIIAAVDDLLFSSRIRSVAKAHGVEAVFARTPEAILSETRARKPALVVLDLDAGRIRPLEALAALKRDSETALVRTVGFVSHVHADLVAAARAAGADEVLARSAFVNALPSLVEGAR
jgi:PleD family two-component response regulator